MPKHISKLIPLMAFVALVLFLALKKSDSQKNHVDKKSMFKKLHHIKHTTKLKSPIKVSITRSEKFSPSSEPGENLTLTAYVESPQDIENSNFKWSLPEGVEHIDGPLEGSLSSSFKENNVYIYNITINSKSEANQVIHFYVHKDPGSKYSVTQNATYNTLNEDKLNKDKLTLKTSNDNYIETHKKFQ